VSRVKPDTEPTGRLQEWRREESRHFRFLGRSLALDSGRVRLDYALDGIALQESFRLPLTRRAPACSEAVDAALDLQALPIGVETSLTFNRPDGMTMVLAKAEPVAPPMEVRGTINAVDTDAGTANITHGPMTEIGMPGMTMDFAVDPALGTSDLPLDREITLLLRRNPDFSMTLVGTRLEEGM